MRLFLFLFSLASFANADVKLSLKQPIVVEYKSPAWNKNPSEIEHGWILIRDENTDRMISVELSETSENSGDFRGTVQISYNDVSEIDAEVYILPPDIMVSGKPAPDFDELIEQDKIAKKFIALRRLSKRNVQLLGVFDTERASVLFIEDELSAGTVVDRAALEAQIREKDREAKQKVNNLVVAHEAERLRAELVEKQRAQDALAAQAALNESERQRQRQEAVRAGELGLKEFNKNQFANAEKYFEKAIELDPENKSYYFQYGVSLYRINKFNNSVVALNLASGNNFNPIERDYFLALNYLKLNENEKALQYFKKVKDKKDKTLSPSAAFFAGATLFKMEKYEESKPEFEYVLDQSGDPMLDKQAESYIDQIGNILAFNSQKAKKFLINFNLGETYDSDILNEATQESPTALNGFRTNYSGSFEYRPLYTQNHEFSAVLSANDTYSLDSSFKPDHNLQSTDPLIIDFSLPYKFKGKLFDKAYQLTVTPTEETIYMDVDPTRTGIGPREMIISSNVLKFDNTFVMRDDYFATYSLSTRHDDSFIADTVPATSLTGNTTTISTNHIFFKNKKKTEASLYDASLAIDNAKGSDESYQRLDLGFGYIWPAFNDAIINGRIGAFYSKYPTNEYGRIDKGGSLNAGFRKPLSPTWASVSGFTVLINNSNTSSENYNKYTLSTAISYSGGF